MPLTLIKEDGTGRSDANTYASEADADNFFAGHLYSDYWVAPVNQTRRTAALASGSVRACGAEPRAAGGAGRGRTAIPLGAPGMG